MDDSDLRGLRVLKGPMDVRSLMCQSGLMDFRSLRGSRGLKSLRILMGLGLKRLKCPTGALEASEGHFKGLLNVF